MKYIAYGINMVRGDMARRCPGVRLVGTGVLRDTIYEFRGCATVRRCETDVERAQNPKVPVAVWEITQADEHQLDRFEGFPYFYRKKVWTAQMRDGSEVEGMIYLMKTEDGRNPISPPSVSYYRGIVEAYEDLGLSNHLLVLERALERAREVSE